MLAEYLAEIAKAVEDEIFSACGTHLVERVIECNCAIAEFPTRQPAVSVVTAKGEQAIAPLPGARGTERRRDRPAQERCGVDRNIGHAIVDIAGKQFKVAKDQYIYAPKMEGEAGANVSFDKVLLIDNGATVQIGAPVLSGAVVSGKILEHVKGDKVIVFKKKRRKGYVIKNGHRQQFTKVQIESIG